MDFELTSFRQFMLLKNKHIREGLVPSGELIHLAKECVSQHEALSRQLGAQVSNLLNQGRQIKNKANNELLRLQAGLTDLVENYTIHSNMQLLQVLDFIGDEELRMKIRKSLLQDPAQRYGKIEMIDFT
jgi:hypothetical protein